MGEIEMGDWVTIAGAGPYEVAVTDAGPWLCVRVPVPGDLILRSVLPDWCEKVPAPFRPEPGTYWLGSGGYLWQAQRLESAPGTLTLVMVRLVDNMQASPSAVDGCYGPLTQLVPKEQA